MNQKGIILSGLIYVLLTFFLLLLITLLAVLWYRQNATDALHKDADSIYDDIYISEFSKDFAYTGNYQSFTVPATGNYKIDLWGAQGNYSALYAADKAGKGGYVSGNVMLDIGTTLYFYVGGGGANDINGGFNGGGNSGFLSTSGGGGGGGATDVRLAATNKYRYIRDYINGSSANGGNHWIEIQAIDINNNNVALNKPVTGSVAARASYLYSNITDGSTDVTSYGETSVSGLQYVEIDLGAEYDLKEIKVWHYYGSSRAYNATKTILYNSDRTVSNIVYDATVPGTYVETSLGRTYSTTLRERIMVAGGGCGSGFVNASLGNSGGLTGGNSKETGYEQYGGNGSSQIAGGSKPTNYSAGLGLTGGFFGLGGDGNKSVTSGFGGGGGGGYYGGSGGSGAGTGSWGGGGGNSFISGYSGCNAINASGVHTGQPNHYSGHVFNNTQMIDGAAQMPSPTFGAETGHTGNGYARITYLP